MGLKRNDYYVEKYGITLPVAYAICRDVVSDRNGKVSASIIVSQSRENAYNQKFEPFETYTLIFDCDKDIPLWEQVYEKAKEKRFSDWEDDVPNLS